MIVNKDQGRSLLIKSSNTKCGLIACQYDGTSPFINDGVVMIKSFIICDILEFDSFHIFYS